MVTPWRLLLFRGKDGHFFGGQLLAGGGAEGDAAHESGACGARAVGREGEEGVASWAAAAGGAVFDPEQRARQVGEAVGEVLEDDLGRELG